MRRQEAADIAEDLAAEMPGRPVDMHNYAVQISVANVRDGGCLGSTFKEAVSWGKVDRDNEQMVYAEATSVLPLIASYIYHRRYWAERRKRRCSRMFD